MEGFLPARRFLPKKPNGKLRMKDLAWQISVGLQKHILTNYRIKKWTYVRLLYMHMLDLHRTRHDL